MPFIQVKTVCLHFRLRRSERAKRLQMSFKGALFEVVAPPRIKNKEVLQFIGQHQRWMLRQQLHPRFAPTTTHFWPASFLAKECIIYKDTTITLNVEFSKEKSIQLRDNVLIIYVPWANIVAHKLSDYIKQQVVYWYKQEALKAVNKALEQYCPLMTRWPSSVCIKQQKTRWGSCGINDKININWLLILAPAHVLEYVVVHELSHLFHRNHGKRFWAKVEKTFPQYKESVAWLNKNGQALLSL